MRRPSAEALAPALALLLACAAAPLRAEPAARLIDVWLNGERMDAFAPLMQEGGEWFVPSGMLPSWRLLPSGSPRWIDGVSHHSLSPWQPTLDVVNQRLSMVAPVDHFIPQRLRVDGRPEDAAPLIEPLPGFALDYTVNLERDGGVSQHATLFDLRGFGWTEGGLLRTSGVLRGGARTDPLPRWQRLDTAWRHADPQGLWRTTVGDAVTCGGELAPALRFAGVQRSTDFALRPDLVTQPLPSVQGSALVPSGIDLLVEGRTAGSARVGPGRFTLDTLPGVNGAGELRVVQRDVLGRETVQTVPYYLSPRLLRKGLSDLCGEAGVLRRGYATAQDRHDGGFVAGSIRHGLNDTLTLLARAEGSAAVRSLHAGLHLVPARWGVFSAHAGVSQTHGVGSGQRWLLAFERAQAEGNISVSAEHHSRRFRTLDAGTPPRTRASVFGGTRWGPHSLSAGLVWQRDARLQTTRVFTAGVQRRLGPHWFAGLTLFRRDGDGSMALLLTRAIGRDVSVALRAQAGADAGVTVQAQRSEPTEGGMGWRLQGGSGALQALAGASWLGESGRVEVQAARWRPGGGTAWRAGAQGGLLWFGGTPVVGRPLGESAAARVEIDGMPGVGVRLNHRDTAVTDARGHAWVWGLLPWQDNTLGIAADVLPLDVALGVPELRVRPPAQAVVRVRFPVQRSRAALLTVLHPDGRPVAPGSRAHRDGDAGSPFGRDGLVWVTGLGGDNHLRIEGPDGTCHARFTLPDDHTPERIGPLTCTAEAIR